MNVYTYTHIQIHYLLFKYIFDVFGMFQKSSIYSVKIVARRVLMVSFKIYYN